MSTELPCPVPVCGGTIRLKAFLTPGLYDCPCRLQALRYWRETVAFGGSQPRLREATAEDVQDSGALPLIGAAVPGGEP